MSSQPPGARQPLQTYLQTPVRPIVVAQPVQAAPVAQPLYAQQPPQQQQSAQPQRFPPPAPSHGGLFAPAPVPAAAPIVANEHLSSLLGSGVGVAGAAGPGGAAAFRDEEGVAAAPGGPRQSFSVASASPAAVGVSGSPASRPSPLEQTFDHPLLGAGGGGGTAPPPTLPSNAASPSPSPTQQQQQQQQGIVLPGPLGPLGHPRLQQSPSRGPRTGSIGQQQQQQPQLPASAYGSGAGNLHVDPLSQTAPPGGSRHPYQQQQQQPQPQQQGVAPSPTAASQAAWSAQQTLAQQQQVPSQPPTATAPPPQPQLSPDEKLSTLLEGLFGGGQ
jgi:hypothetical protein